MNASNLRAATGARGKFVWTEDIVYEYQNFRKIMRKQLKLSPYDPKQKLKFIIDGAPTAGTGFLLIQYVDDKDLAKGVKIIHSGSNLLPLDQKFSSMVAEAIALDRAITA